MMRSSPGRRHPNTTAGTHSSHSRGYFPITAINAERVSEAQIRLYQTEGDPRSMSGEWLWKRWSESSNRSLIIWSSYACVSAHRFLCELRVRLRIGPSPPRRRDAGASPSSSSLCVAARVSRSSVEPGQDHLLLPAPAPPRPALKFGFEFLKCRLPIALLLLKQAQSFANDLACRLVSAAGDALLDELFELRGQRNI